MTDKCLICTDALDKTLYSYKVSGHDVNLCETCETDLLKQMFCQFILENKLKLDIPYVENHMIRKSELVRRVG